MEEEQNIFEQISHRFFGSPGVAPAQAPAQAPVAEPIEEDEDEAEGVAEGAKIEAADGGGAAGIVVTDVNDDTPAKFSYNSQVYQTATLSAMATAAAKLNEGQSEAEIEAAIAEAAKAMPAQQKDATGRRRSSLSMVASGTAKAGLSVAKAPVRGVRRVSSLIGDSVNILMDEIDNYVEAPAAPKPAKAPPKAKAAKRKSAAGPPATAAFKAKDEATVTQVM